MRLNARFAWSFYRGKNRVLQTTEHFEVARIEITMTNNFAFRCVANMNPERGNKRPSKEATVAVGGHFSSRRVHDKLSNYSIRYEEYFAENDATDSNQSEEEN